MFRIAKDDPEKVECQRKSGTRHFGTLTATEASDICEQFFTEASKTQKWHSGQPSVIHLLEDFLSSHSEW